MTKATFGGAPLNGRVPVGWPIQSGTHPSTAIIELEAGLAAQIIESAGTPQTLTINDGNNTLDIRQLFALREVASTAPYLRAFLVSDRRWKWARAHVLGRYNIRRRTGQKRIRQEGDLPIEIAGVVDDFLYAPWSLNNKIRWNAQDLMQDVLEKLKDTDPFPFTVPDIAGSRQVPIDNLEIDDSGPEAISRMLDYAVGYDIYVDYGGGVVIYDKLDGSERNIVTKGDSFAIVGSQIPRDVTFKATRPSKIKVYFTREIEVRFDHSSTSVTTTNEDHRLMDNVLPITDPKLVVSGNTLANGTWITFPEAITAFNNAPNPGGEPLAVGAPQITDLLIRENYLIPTIWNLYTPFGDSASNTIWMGRQSSIRNHYRQTFRIPRRWMDKFYHIEAVRAGIVDVTTGTRAVSQAFTNWCYKPSIRGFLLDLNKQFLGMNVDGYPGSPDTPLSAGKTSPCAVQIIDDHAGIIHLDYRVDMYGMVTEAIPSKVDNIPTANVSDITKPLTWGTKSQNGGFLPTLSSAGGVALVITAIPSAPNNKNQLHFEEVTPADVEGLGVPVGPSDGPVWEIRVGGAELTAQFVWSDSEKAAIEQAFGVNVADGVKGEENKKLLLLLLKNEAEVKDFAKAKAAALWSMMKDRYMGSKSVRLDPSIRPTGSIGGVSHTLGTDGAAITTYEMSDEIVPLNAFALLPPNSRRVILREIVPK